MEVRTRFAPSPTGFLHIGGARTALFNWLHAKNRSGKFLLRIEDTDYARSDEESVKAILDGMAYLGLTWDEGPYFQSERLEIYRKYSDHLVKEGKAYRCYCTKEELDASRANLLKEGKKPSYNRRCLNDPPRRRSEYVLRFLCPDAGETVVDDQVKGRIIFKNSELDDLVIVRSDGIPTYNFTVVVDDALMGITHVVRGDDHLNNTPRQIQLYNALGFNFPLFSHVPMILGSDKTRLSKRHGAMSITAYRDLGYLPDAMINYLVRLGWSYGDQEIFSVDELCEKFSMENIGKSSGIFNPEKLLWVNHQHIIRSSPGKIAKAALPFFKNLGLAPSLHPRYEYAVKTLQERSKTLVELSQSGVFYFQEKIVIEEEGKKKFLKPDVAAPLTGLIELLAKLDPFDEDGIAKCFESVMERYSLKLGKIAQPVRVALTGKRVSPGIYEVIFVLGKDLTIKRLKNALALIQLDSQNL